MKNPKLSTWEIDYVNALSESSVIAHDTNTSGHIWIFSVVKRRGGLEVRDPSGRGLIFEKDGKMGFWDPKIGNGRWCHQ